MKYFIFCITAGLFIAGCGTEQGQEEKALPPAEAKVMSPGKKLFINNCAQCHAVTKDKVGPKLEGVMERWENDTTRIMAFIRNAQQAVESGDERAEKVYNDWNNAIMTPMPHLSDRDINHILEYIDEGKD